MRFVTAQPGGQPGWTRPPNMKWTGRYFVPPCINRELSRLTYPYFQSLLELGPSNHSSGMATLQLVWNHRRTHNLWSWTMGNTHQTARILKCIKNRVYTAHIGPRGMEATDMIVVKTAIGPDEMLLLSREAEFYANELCHLQGTVVPKYFGFFRGKTNGDDFGCLLLEYCSGRAPVWDIQEFKSVPLR